jgi:glycine hydroxymethyltransferase
MREIADSVGAYYLADIAHEAGLVAAGVNSSPFPHAHIVTMTTRKTLRGPIGAMIFCHSDLAKRIDFAVFPGLQGGPQNHSIAGICTALHEASLPEFKVYSEQVINNAQALATELIKLGFDLVSGGTDKHLVLIDLRNKNISGKDAALQLEKVGIIANKNTIPGETGKPWDPSGLRIGTPAMTTKGWKENDFRQLAHKINSTLS